MRDLSLRSLLTMSRTRAVPVVALSLGLVGWVDFVTGNEVRVLALYFLPLLLAGWNLGVRGAAVASLFATTMWVSILYASHTRYEAPYVWAVNALTEGTGFLIVSVLMARFRVALDREMALSRTDPLTGLFNRRAMTESVSRGIALCRRNARPASLLCIDLNDFKLANDRFGHHRGDELLRQCASLLRSLLRTSDVIARVGGDEFIVFLPETGAEQAGVLVERIRAAVDAAPDFRATGVTLSIGAFSEAPARSDLEAMLREADALMYEAKRRTKLAGWMPPPGAAPSGG